MSTAICNSFGVRKLSDDEIKELPTLDPYLKCFWDESGNKLSKKTSTVWAFREALGTYFHYADINEAGLLFASKIRDVMFVKKTDNKVPDIWVKVHDHILLKRNGSGLIEPYPINHQKILENQGFKDFINKGGFAIVNCEHDKTIGEAKHNYRGYKVFYSESTNFIPQKYEVQLFQSVPGSEIFVRFGQIPLGKRIILDISVHMCNHSLELRGNDLILKYKETLICFTEGDKVILLRK